MKTTRTIFGAALGAVAIGVAQPVWAQSQALQRPVDTASVGLEEVVVTARRRAENLQKVPIAITALSQRELDRNNIGTVGDLQHVVPSLSLFSSQSRDEPMISLRGQGGYSPGASPAVGVYVNEVPLVGGTNGNSNSPGGGPGRYYDLEAVQVLKGPQGTLFGRNSTGGAILFQTRRPSNEGYIQGTYGNYNDKEIQGALNIPVVRDKLLVRFSASAQDRDGFTRSLGTPSHPNGLDLDDRNFVATRATVTFKPVDQFQNDLIYDGINSKTHGASAILSVVNPIFAFGVYPFIFPNSDINGTLAQQNALGVRTQVPIDTDTSTSYNALSFTDIARYDATETITFRNIFGYSKTRSRKAFDGDGSALPIASFPSSQPGHDVVEQYTEEFQAQGKSFAGELTWVVGAFYLRSPAQNFNNVLLTSFGSVTRVQGRTAETSTAGYAQGTYDLSAVVEGLKLTGGFRYTWDRRFSEAQQTSVFTGACLSPTANAQCGLIGRGTFSAPTWTIGLDYQAAPGTLMYLVSRRGYRTGGFNTSAIDPRFRSFSPEYVDDLELGVKSEWNVAGIEARTNAAFYGQIYKDIQLTQSLLDGGTPTQVVSNAAKARIMGAEFEGTLFPVEGVEIGAQLTWLDFKYLKFISEAERLAIATGFRQTNMPRYKYGLNARYHLPVDTAWGDISFGATWSWQARSFITTAPDPRDTQPDYGLLNTSADWRNVGGSAFDAAFFMTNATNKVYAVGGFPISNLVGTSTVMYGEPRMFGFRLKYAFGASGK